VLNTVEFTEQEIHPGKVQHFELKQNILTLSGENYFVMKVEVLSDYIFRFRYAVEGTFDRDFSYAIDTEYKFEDCKAELIDQLDRVVLKTKALIVQIYKYDFRVRIIDHNGFIISEDEKGFHWEKNVKFGGQIVKMSKISVDGEAFYGLGDKPTDLNLKGKRFVNWGTDEYGYHKNTDPIYKSIPIYYGLHQGTAYGIFFDNTFEAHFDFGKERSTVTSFWAQGGEMNYYFIGGPQLIDACKRYTLLTGTPDMPPMWALGFQQCKWSYYPETKVKEVTAKMRDLRIPCDAIYLDIDYMEGFRCFTWNKEHFPNPKQMVADLKADGFKTMVIIDPGIKKDMDYDVFKQGLENDYYCRHADGPYVEGKVWPGDCYFPDFTRPEVRTWWAGLYKELIEEIDIAGVWNDMNEPALFEVKSKTFPSNVLHNYDGDPTSHRKAHNIYGMQMARATADGVKQFRNGLRTLIITRSGYAGLQRFTCVWTGDNIASWEHLWLADVQAQRLSISGISFCGSDIGGFIGQPNAEMMIRWIQLGIFHPFCRVHSSGDHGDQEPWAFGEECTNMFRKFIEIRYQLLPYMYTTFYQYHSKGIPMLRPIIFYDQEDKNIINKDHEFLCGDHILISPVTKEKATTKKIYLPKGKWYNYWTNEILEGKKEHTVKATLDIIPIFIQEGAIIPKYPIMQYVGEKPIEAVKLTVYFKTGTEQSALYEDDRTSYAYNEGNLRYATFTYNGTENEISIQQAVEGDYKPDFEQYKLQLIGVPFTVNEVLVDGLAIAFDAESIALPIGFSEVILK